MKSYMLRFFLKIKRILLGLRSRGVNAKYLLGSYNWLPQRQYCELEG